MKRIYFDSAATSYYRPPQVAEAVVAAMQSMGNSSRGTHEEALAGARVIAQTRQLLDKLFEGEGPEQVAFTMNSTESLNIALKGLLKPGDKVVTTVMEHNSVLRPLYQLESRGVEVVYAGCCQEQSMGLLDMEGFLAQIRPGVRAVVCTHASNLTGNVLDIRRIGMACREAGAVLIVDASQTAGVLPLSMKRDFIDILCFTGHKGLMGPQGTGGICLKKGIVLEPLLTGGSGILTYSPQHPQQMPAALEAGTLNGHGLAGLRAALLWIEENGGTQEIYRKENALAKAFYRKVKTIPGIRLYGDYRSYEEEDGQEDICPESRVRAPMVTLNLGQEDSGEVSDWLAQEWGIDTRSGGHCAPLMHKALGTKEQGAVRFSFSRFNTMEEVEKAAQALREF